MAIFISFHYTSRIFSAFVCDAACGVLSFAAAAALSVQGFSSFPLFLSKVQRVGRWHHPTDTTPPPLQDLSAAALVGIKAFNDNAYAVHLLLFSKIKAP